MSTPLFLLAPAANQTFMSMPSGATYVSNAYGLVTITNGSVADEAALIAAGCLPLIPATSVTVDVVAAGLLTFPATVAASGTWTSAAIPCAQNSAIVAIATSTQAGTLTITRYADAALTKQVGAVQSVALAASTAGWVSVDDGVPFLWFTVSISNPGGSTATVSNGACLTGQSVSGGTVTANLGTLNGAATAANQATGNASLATIATNTADAGTPTIHAGTNIIGKVGIDQTTPGTTNAVVSQAQGTVGTDYSANQPTLPTVGTTPFGGSSGYAAYVLLKTIPALSTRNAVEIQNQSAGTLVVIRDDGTAGGGATPANASLIVLGSGGGAGSQGAGWSSLTFKGRLQIYGPTGSQLSSFVD
jgi:hypothetical protein